MIAHFVEGVEGVEGKKYVIRSEKLLLDKNDL